MTGTLIVRVSIFFVVFDFGCKNKKKQEKYQINCLFILLRSLFSELNSSFSELKDSLRKIKSLLMVCWLKRVKKQPRTVVSRLLLRTFARAIANQPHV